jgi:DNA-binding transcriptional MocR family regulator
VRAKNGPAERDENASAYVANTPSPSTQQQATSTKPVQGGEPADRPSGGMFVWARVPGVDDSARLVDTARLHGLDLAPGCDYRPNGAATPWVRVNVAAVSDPLAQPFLYAAGRL